MNPAHPNQNWIESHLMLYPHCLLSWSTASKVNHNKHYLGLPDTFCILSFLLPTRQSSRSWPDRHNTPLLWIQKLILGEPVGERSHLSTGVAKVEDMYLQLLGVIFAGMQKELRRDRQKRDKVSVLEEPSLGSCLHLFLQLLELCQFLLNSRSCYNYFSLS